jgi:hypothetical protein
MSTSGSLRALLFYAVAALAMTWPLAADLTGSLPGDLGDPLLNTWILAWGADHIGAMLTGDAGAFARWWHANIFHPAPLALAYSEHLFPQALAALPVYAVSGNALLAYNVVYLSTYVLSGLGMFLLVRELTGRPRAAFAAGLFFAFVPYRISQTPHLQILSAQWMPFVLYGLRRYFDRGRPLALAGATAALVAQQLSSGYFLFYFTPFAAAYAAWEITARGRWRDRPLLGALAVAAAADLALLVPFLAPYRELRQLDFAPRSLDELRAFSADVLGYFTVATQNRLWGGVIDAFRKHENYLFPGVLPLAASLTAVALFVRERLHVVREIRERAPRWLLRALAALALGAAATIALVAFTGPVHAGGEGWTLLRIRQIDRAVAILAVSAAALVALSQRLRNALAPDTDLRLPALLFLAAAVVLSLGPVPASAGRRLGIDGPYLWLYQLVPGFDGLRVPARFAMVAYVFLSMLAGYGLAWIDRLRRGPALVAIAGVLFLIEATAAPIGLNLRMGARGLGRPPNRVEPAASAPPVYHALRALPPGTVVAELPFGATAWELRYVYYSTVHRHRLLNGFSGGFPRSYHEHRRWLENPAQHPGEAWAALRRAGTTHVVVHRPAYGRQRSEAVLRWLNAGGARHVRSYDRSELFELPRN